MRAPRPGIFVLLAALARAADPTPPPGDSIATAKADLAAIRSPQTQTESSPALPSLDMKDVASVPNAQLPDLSSLLAPDSELGPDGLKKKKPGTTGNWLVDAMDKDAADRKSERAGTSRSKEKDDLLKGDVDPLGTTARIGKDGLPVEESRDKAAPAEPAPPAYNPLDSFMSSWVSAKDHDLLVPSAKADGLAGDGFKGRTDTLQSLELGPSASQGDSLLPAADASAIADLKQAPNPYLAELEAPPAAPMRTFSAPELPFFDPAEPVDAIRPSTVNGFETKPSDATHSFIPDFAQPPDDDKYFKQMKRF
jgi:hypothetical protein